MINEFIEKIVVHERDRKGSTDTTQEVEIYFNFIGRYVPMSLSEPVELYSRRTGRALKSVKNAGTGFTEIISNERSKVRYKRIMRKSKAKKKQAMDEMKNKLRAEDIEKGIFTPKKSTSLAT